MVYWECVLGPLCCVCAHEFNFKTENYFYIVFIHVYSCVVYTGYIDIFHALKLQSKLNCVQWHTNDRPHFGVPSIPLWHRPWCQYLCILYSVCRVFNVLARAFISQNVTLTRKSHVSKKYGYFYWIKIVCIVFALDLSLSVCVSVCVLSYKLSRRYYVIGEQFKRNASSLNMSLSNEHTIHYYTSIHISWL